MGRIRCAIGFPPVWKVCVKLGGIIPHSCRKSKFLSAGMRGIELQNVEGEAVGRKGI